MFCKISQNSGVGGVCYGKNASVWGSEIKDIVDGLVGGVDPEALDRG